MIKDVVDDINLTSDDQVEVDDMVDDLKLTNDGRFDGDDGFDGFIPEIEMVVDGNVNDEDNRVVDDMVVNDNESEVEFVKRE